MENIVTPKQAIRIARKLRSNKKLVIVGGCFDILHVGHIRFLDNARKSGNSLIVLLESDKTVNKLKGPKRPFNTQRDRAEILSHIKSVDYVVMLEAMQSNKSYDKLLIQLRPKVLAATQDDPGIIHKKRQAEIINAQVKIVIDRLKDYSSTKLGNSLSQK